MSIINTILAYLFWILVIGVSLWFLLFPQSVEDELKVYLDDERQTPDGWVRVSTYEDCIDILATFKPTHLSLDHDLGTEKTGYDVVKWIEEKTYHNPKYNPPIITIHSANPAGRQNMERGIQSIQKIVSQRI